MLARLLLFCLVLLAACGDVPIDDQRNDRRLFPPRGLIRGTVTYVGPRPCSRAGDIVGNAVILVFDRRNPPPPTGLATSAVNFVAVPGNVLFANEPRSTSGELYCPDDGATVEASAPFAVAPLQGGSYVISAFYDRRGRFWPTFKFRNLPEAGDIAGGFIDVEDARKNAGNLAYTPIYRPIDVGIAQQAPAGEIPNFTIPDKGFVADNIPVTLGSVVPFTRPYFHPRRVEREGREDSSDVIGTAVRSTANERADPFAVPILAMTQDVHILAPPTNPTAESLDAFQRGFQSLRISWGLPEQEVADAVDPRQPFGFQLPSLPPRGKGGLLVFSRGGTIPENPAVPALWPQVALVKLADDPQRRTDLQSLVVQGSLEESNVTGKPPGPLVVIQAITLDRDSLAKTVAGPISASPSTAALRSHFTALVRPAALCFDPRRVDLGGVLVAPHFTGISADAAETGELPLFDRRALERQPLVREVRRGCLPLGRYAISLVYPSGQAWTVPNESGGCSEAEGSIRLAEKSTCSTKPRTVLLSQGARAVVEIVGPSQEGLDSGVCSDNPVPPECLPP
ncbi:MAG: hypothetical protein KIT84_39720 [Labilithrix sp.]|nr:hypothetical protein [Labilithrix sp.]MCW5817193.1 hypothetical protein [Labilithrix sp.]